MKRVSREELQQDPDKFFKEFFKCQEERKKKGDRPELILIQGGKSDLPLLRQAFLEEELVIFKDCPV